MDESRLELVSNCPWIKKYQWVVLTSIVKVTSDVHEKLTGKDTTETRWYISSLSLNAERALYAERNHWQLESMHWMLDMTFREGEFRIRKGNGALAFNVMRKVAMGLFKRKRLGKGV
jgi:predicted transposase YbfD/YdcC